MMATYAVWTVTANPLLYVPVLQQLVVRTRVLHSLFTAASSMIEYEQQNPDRSLLTVMNLELESYGTWYAA